ncbi:hypothetical protein BDZ88DRAFT_454435 [Geranomyces variabilis]|nr:hypothetical protein BDZ88DRAFT_454435 [Geranomyces variabilis]KAJ3131961.1 Uncharacterized protein HDU90_007623 [Geranomyces variabilis]
MVVVLRKIIPLGGQGEASKLRELCLREDPSLEAFFDHKANEIKTKGFKKDRAWWEHQVQRGYLSESEWKVVAVPNSFAIERKASGDSAAEAAAAEEVRRATAAAVQAGLAAAEAGLRPVAAVPSDAAAVALPAATIEYPRYRVVNDWMWAGYDAKDRYKLVTGKRKERSEEERAADVQFTPIKVSVASAREVNDARKGMSRAEKRKQLRALSAQARWDLVPLRTKDEEDEKEEKHIAEYFEAPKHADPALLPFRPPIAAVDEDMSEIFRRLHPDVAEDLRAEVEDFGKVLDLRFVANDSACAVIDGQEPVVFAGPFTPAVLTQWFGDLNFGRIDRAGLPGQLHRVSRLETTPVGKLRAVTLRLGRVVFGPAWVIADLIAQGKSMLIIAPPAAGKTTLLRDVARLLRVLCPGERIVVVDQSDELGGASDRTHWFLAGMVLMRLAGKTPGEAVDAAFRNHSPTTIIADEVATPEEARAIWAAREADVRIIATTHGSLAKVIDNRRLKDLVGDIASSTQSDDSARDARGGFTKVRKDRQQKPAFDVIIEVVSKTEWRVHHDMAKAVDNSLQRCDLYYEERKLDEDGILLVRDVVCELAPGGGAPPSDYPPAPRDLGDDSGSEAEDA